MQMMMRKRPPEDFYAKSAQATALVQGPAEDSGQKITHEKS